MDDFPSSAGIRQEPARDRDAHSIDSDRADLYDESNGNGIVTYAPKERFRLGYFTVSCLVINRMIGTGIFMSPQRVIQGTMSTGASLLFWVAGIIYCICGTHVYIEYGLNIPRYVINGVEQSVPRSGGDLNYLQYVYTKPAYRKNTVLLSTCIFGISFIILGNMAGNSINFAHRVLLAANVQDPSNGAVRGIAMAVATLTCFIHAISRRGGLWLNNTLAIVKVGIMLLIIITAACVGGNALPKTENVFTDNISADNSFRGGSNQPNGYAHAFLAIIFSFSGFEQPNYVLGEISRPRKKFPRAMSTGVGIVLVLYLAVNLSYTYTAARVKQEIAKEGILPFPKFFSQNTDMSVGRVMRWFQKHGMFKSIMRLSWFSPEEHSEKTPVGALVLHFVSCLVLIFATWGMKPTEAYTLLTSWSAYVVTAFMSTFLGLGILILRFRGPPPTAVNRDGDEPNDQTIPENPTWTDLTGKGINPVVSIIAASVYMAGGLYPVIATWVPPTGLYEQLTKPKAEWWIVPTVSWCVIGLGIAWFLGFVGVAKHIDRKDHRVFVVEKRPEFEPAEGSGKSDVEGSSARVDPRRSGGLVQVHETVYLSWVGRETLRQRRQGTADGDGTQMEERRESNLSPYAGTDFDGYFTNLNATPGQGRYQY
ncbi:high-affinity methionine permease [Verticillium alfalfae VaMs.102]|uniref:High-affinity methionine permease n=1 Tax=Verticillium alfalfae (strain VaMs.102 / ATCC MYA-4576 / FGSC 10136) TaxID=526221 RepID=C9SQ62_VERA1|nr:high-affinity methionine permease [Verticillium alfalfae VaMs.102]EEY20987.1 high-affinity methionine permease [Verticillium alfalfae VaMs.102]